MKIALAAKPVIDRDIAHNLQVILQTLELLKEQADLVLFGEATLHGFDALTWDPVQDSGIAVCQDSNAIASIRQAAKTFQTAVCFGYLEKTEGNFYSSQMFVGHNGEIVQNYRRVSPGWREHFTDPAYKEGPDFTAFSYGGRRFSIALCGDLWYDENVRQIAQLHPDIVLWPVWCDYAPEKWNGPIKKEYAAQAALTDTATVLVNPVCTTPGRAEPSAAGGTALFDGGIIRAELPAGHEGVLIVDI